MGIYERYAVKVKNGGGIRPDWNGGEAVAKQWSGQGPAEPWKAVPR